MTPIENDAAEQWLVVRCQIGERPAFDALIRRWQPPIWTYLRHLAGDADVASDLAQDTWLRVMRGIFRLREPSRFRGWLFGIARRTWLDRLRRSYAEPATVDVETSTLAQDADEPTALDVQLMMAQGLQRLPAPEREVVVLFHIQALSLADIADVLDVPVGTVKSRLFRARALLRAALIHNEGER